MLFNKTRQYKIHIFYKIIFSSIGQDISKLQKEISYLSEMAASLFQLLLHNSKLLIIAKQFSKRTQPSLLKIKCFLIHKNKDCYTIRKHFNSCASKFKQTDLPLFRTDSVKCSLIHCLIKYTDLGSVVWNLPQALHHQVMHVRPRHFPTLSD